MKVVSVYKNIVILVKDRDTPVGPYLLDMIDFDVIFGMDWLASHYATIDCNAKWSNLHLWVTIQL